MMPDQKEEHLEIVRPEVLYLSTSISFHLPEEVGSLNLKYHLASKEISILSKLRTPKPPWSLPRHTCSHLIKWYFRLVEDEPDQRNFFLNLSILFLILTGILYMESQYSGIADRTELSIVTLPPSERRVPFHVWSFFFYFGD